jgi:hypothetical protein
MAMPKRTRRAVSALNQIDNRIITVGHLFPSLPGWWVQADCGPSTAAHITYTADGPFEELAEAIQNAHDQAVELGWERNSYMVSVDQ